MQHAASVISTFLERGHSPKKENKQAAAMILFEFRRACAPGGLVEPLSAKAQSACVPTPLTRQALTYHAPS